MGRRVITARDVLPPPGRGLEVEAEAAPLKRGAVLRAAGVAPAAALKPDDYATRLLKYIPGEIVAAFLVISAMIGTEDDVAKAVPWIVFGALLVLTPLYLWRVTSEPGKPSAMSHIIIGTVAFAIWVFALGGPFAASGWYEPIYGSVLLIVYTLAIPVFIGK